MKRLAYLLLIVWLTAAACMLASCSLGPDTSSEVLAHAASWSAAPVYHNGVMLSPGGAPPSRKTMFHD